MRYHRRSGARCYGAGIRSNSKRRPHFVNEIKCDPHWHDLILFHEYFHGDNGAGLGASNQTGWTALVAKLIHQYGEYALEHKSANLIEQESVGHA